MNARSLLLALAMSLQCVSPTFAQDTLNEQTLSRFAQTWDSLTMRLVEADAEFDPTHLPGLVGQLKSMAAADGEGSALDKAVMVDGYADFETWSDIASRAITCAQWAKAPPNREELDKAIMVITADADIEPSQKESLIKDLSQAFDKALADKPTEADISAAKAVLPLLEPILSSGE